MDKIWANRLVAGTKTFNDVPAARRNGVMTVLQEMADNGDITAATYKEITGKAL